MAVAPPDLLQEWDRVRPLLSRPRLGLMLDFDGTISEIVPTPSKAVVDPACKAALDRLRGLLPLVAVVSGRAAEDVARRVDLPGLIYVGNHGAEYIVGGQHKVLPEAAAYVHRVRRLIDGLRERVRVPGLVWDYKGPSASVHFRRVAQPEEARQALKAALKELPEAAGLQTFWGKLLLEIRPPVAVDKGAALRRLVQEARPEALVFVGDDVTDLDALRALRALRGEGGLEGLGIVVLHHDTPPALLKEADYSLDGVRAVARFLEALARLRGPAS